MEPCDIYWHSIVYSDLKYIVTNANSRVNKFPGMTELAKKVALTRAILSMKMLFDKEYEFYPNSWFIPAQLNDFTYTFYQVAIDKYFTSGAQGTGIYLIQSPDEIKDRSSRQLIQEYIADPLLMSEHLKFDLRVYAVIKSINPLSIYVAREGMVRFCTEKYVKPTRENADNLYAHLTNYSLNKSNQSYVHSYSLADQMHASKRLLSSVFYQLEMNGVNVRLLWHNIKIIIVKTILAMIPEIMLNYEHYFCDSPGPQCFQIVGFDILIKEDETPILLEVNSAPSLTVDHIVDEAIKIPLVRDTILLVLDLLDKDCNTKTLKFFYTIDFQIFPNRYRQNSGHLLFLDKAMYLYMQFINIKATITITLSGVRSFVRKCNLLDVISLSEAEQKFREIYINFTGEHEISVTSGTGLPFHAFLQLLYYIAELKFFKHDTLLEKVQDLLIFCDLSLRHYGIRSARLRRTEIDKSDKENCVEIYLLPSRLAERRGGNESKRRRTAEQRLAQRQRYGHSLPRAANISSPNSSRELNQQQSVADVKNKTSLPKLRPPFVFGLR
uniref:Tubulin--tyrosine ligase-like protein 9 n=1 Tax=Syphacia muris TaxID=451379 RepID=A0A0N5ANB1_9BILA